MTEWIDELIALLRENGPMLTMKSAKRGNKPATIVQIEGASWADVGLRERESREIVHLREDMFEPCQRCGVSFGVWLENASSHAVHPYRCTEIVS